MSQQSAQLLEVTAEISALIETLVQTEHRLAELTAGEVDTVANHQGRTLMLRRSQDALRDSETVKLAAILNALPANIAVLDAHGVIVAVNESWRNFAASNGLLCPHDGVGMNYFDVCDVIYAKEAGEAIPVAAGIRSVLSGRSQRFSIEYPCHFPLVQRWFLMTVTPLSEDRANGAVVMHLDVTAERQSVNALETSELRFRQMADHISDVFFLQNLDGTEIYYVSPAYEHIWGRSCESLYANPRSWADALHPDDLQYAITQVSEDGNAEFGHEYRIIRPDGEIRWIHVREFVILDAAGEPYRIAGVCTDITQRKLATDELRTSEARFRSLTGLSSDWYWEQDQEHRFTALNGRENDRSWDKDRFMLIGLRRWKLPGAAPISQSWEQHKAVLDAHKPFRNFEYQRIIGNGMLKHVSANGEPVFDADGSFTGYRGVGTDITERKLASLELRESESRFRSLTELSSDWYWEQDEEYRYVGFSGGESSIKWGSDQRALLGMRRWELTGITPLSDSWDQHRALLDARKPFRNFEYQHVLENGSIRYVSASGEPTFDADGRFSGYRGVATDITERKRAEEALRASELQQRQLAGELDIERSRLVAAQRLAKVGSWETDVATKAIIWSEETYRIFETDLATFRPTHDAFLAIVHPEDRARVNEAFVQSLMAPAAYKIVQHRLMLPDGRIKFVEERWRVRFDEQAHPVKVIGTSQDVTERMRVEEEIRSLNADLERRVEERTAELEAANHELEAFDYSVAHDLRAPLRHIEGFSTMLVEDYGDKLDARGREYLEKLKGAGKRMELLVGDLLALSLVSRSELNRSDVDVSALAQLVFASLHEAEPTREVESVIGPSLRVNADLGLLRIVLENLIGNAWKFTGKQPVARIEFGCLLRDNVPTFFVRDNGAGFDRAYADRLFAPFQRLHAQCEFKGTGIGLATVSRIITRHGGKVWAEGIVDHGATFHFTLPL